MIEVLVVDDDTGVARVNAAYVEKVAGFHVAGVAHNVAEALHRLEMLPPWTWSSWTTICRTAQASWSSRRCGAGATRAT